MDKTSIGGRSLTAISWLSLGSALAVVAGAYAGDSAAPCEAVQVERAMPQAAAMSPRAVGAGSESGAGDQDRQVWFEVFATIARRADSGSTTASAMALEMHRHGRQVYGISFDASAQQLQRWQRQQRCSADACTAGG